jgi:hypothetical protein
LGEAFLVAETMHDCNEWYGLDWKLRGLKVLSNKMNLAGIGVILHTMWLESQALTLKKNTAIYYFGENPVFRIPLKLIPNQENSCQVQIILLLMLEVF